MNVLQLYTYKHTDTHALTVMAECSLKKKTILYALALNGSQYGRTHLIDG